MIPAIVFFSPAEMRPPVRVRKIRSDAFPESHKQFLRDHWQDMTNAEIAQVLGRSVNSVASMGSVLGLKKNLKALYSIRSHAQRSKQTSFSEQECQFLIDHWQTMTIAQMADALGRTYGSVKSKGQKGMGLKKSPEAIRALSLRPNAGQFKKGQLPPNTVFGDEQVIRVRKSKKGPDYKYIRTGFRQWQEYHRWLWIKHHGPVPKGYVVIFINGDQMDVRIDNLKLITLRENRLRNSGSVNLTDGYVANALTHDPETKALVLQQPGLIELKRAELLLSRQLKSVSTDDH